MPYPTDPDKYNQQFVEIAKLMYNGVVEIPLHDVMNAKKLRHDWYGFVRAHPKHIRTLEERIYRTKHPSPNNPDQYARGHVETLRDDCLRLQARYEAIRNYEVQVDGNCITFVNKTRDPRFANVAAQIAALQAEHNVPAGDPFDPHRYDEPSPAMLKEAHRIADTQRNGQAFEELSKYDQPKFGDDFFIKLPGETGDYEPDMSVLTDAAREEDALQEVKDSGIQLDDMLGASAPESGGSKDTEVNPDDYSEPNEGNSSGA